MPLKKEVVKEIRLYLERAAVELGGMDAGKKDEILRDVESHIYAALEKHGGDPTIDDLKVVLAGMERPSAWARESAGESTVREPRACCEPRAVEVSFSWAAIASGLTAPVTLALLAIGVLADSTRHMVWTAGIGGLTTVLALVALSKIRVARGAVMGLPLAVACAVLFPVTVASFLILWVAAEMEDSLHASLNESELAAAQVVIYTLMLALIMLFAVWTFRRVWRWAARPPAHGEAF